MDLVEQSLREGLGDLEFRLRGRFGPDPQRVAGCLQAGLQPAVGRVHSRFKRARVSGEGFRGRVQVHALADRGDEQPVEPRQGVDRRRGNAVGGRRHVDDCIVGRDGARGVRQAAHLAVHRDLSLTLPRAGACAAGEREADPLGQVLTLQRELELVEGRDGTIGVAKDERSARHGDVEIDGGGIERLARQHCPR